MKSDFKKLENRGWSALQDLLEIEMPQPEKPRRSPLLWLFSGIVIGGLLTFSCMKLIDNQYVINNENKKIEKSVQTKSEILENRTVAKNMPQEVITAAPQVLPNSLKKPNRIFFNFNTPSLTYQNTLEKGVSVVQNAEKMSENRPNTGGGAFFENLTIATSASTQNEQNLENKNNYLAHQAELNLLSKKTNVLLFVDKSKDSAAIAATLRKIKMAESNLVRPISQLERAKTIWEGHMNTLCDFKSFGGIELGIARTRFFENSPRFSYQIGISASFLPKNDESWTYLQINRNIDKTRPSLVPVTIDAYGMPYRITELYYLNVPIRLSVELDDHWSFSAGVKLSGLLDYKLESTIDPNSTFYGYGTKNKTTDKLSIGEYYLADNNFENVRAPLSIRRFDVAQLVGLGYRGASGLHTEFFYQHGWFSPSQERVTDQNFSRQRFNRLLGVRLSLPIR
jgi:hypothetical protein